MPRVNCNRLVFKLEKGAVLLVTFFLSQNKFKSHGQSDH